MGVFNELQKIWSRIRGIEQRLEGYDEVVIVSALPTNPIDGVMYSVNNNFYYHDGTGWHTAVFVPSDVSELTDTTDLISTAVYVTHSDLKALVASSGLQVGQRYLITDFAQSYNIFDGGTMEIIEEKVGALEPIIVTAISTTELYKVAISTVYPQDIIHYSLDILDIRDIGFGNGVDTVNANFKGMIYYRKDTIQNVETHYDFRNVKFRRWAVNATAHIPTTFAYIAEKINEEYHITADVAGAIGNSITITGDGVLDITALISAWNIANPANTATVITGGVEKPEFKQIITLANGVGAPYAAKDVCKSTDGKIYKCINAVNSATDPSSDAVNWVLWLDITADAFVSWTADKTKFNIGGITTTNLIIKNVTAGVDYDDFTTFGDYYKWVKDVEIGGINLELIIDDFSFASILLSQKVFKTADNPYTCFSIKFGDNNLPMTFGDNNGLMTFGDYNQSMTFGNGHRSMTFGDYNQSMTFGNGNGSMTFGNYNQSMTFGNGNNFMTFGNDTNPENRMITFGDYTTMCVFEHRCFIGLAADLDLSAATHIRGAYNTTIYQDAVDGVKLSYMTGGVLTIADVTD